jgi:putative hydrolase of the HAD superfamily
MKYQAVIFDLFGTLIDNFSLQEYRDLLGEMADILGAPREGFIDLWVETFNARMIGTFSTVAANIKHICQALGVHPKDEALAVTADLRLEMTRRGLQPRPGAVELLESLKTSGYKIGLISDCSSEVPLLWDKTPFAPLMEAAVFSCELKIKKPDPRIYLFACEQLGVKPEDCLYIGDGSSRELTGAQGVGMSPVRILMPHELSDSYRVDTEDWPGPVISSFQEIPALLE